MAAALGAGYDGLRLSGNAFWMATNHWDAFCKYERELDDLLSGQPMIALCTYSLQRSCATEVLDVARAHQFTLARRRGAWEYPEPPNSSRPSSRS